MENEPFDRKLWWKFWRRAVLAAWFLRFVPYVRMIGLNGSMVTGSLRRESDIDLYIAVEGGHIYSCRIMTTLLVHLMGIRRHGNLVAGRVCLNRYATIDFLRVTPENLYHARVFHNLVPLFSTSSAYARYAQANQWMGEFGYQIRTHEPVLRDSLVSRSLRGLCELLLMPISAALENRSRVWQNSRLVADSRALEPGSRIILNDSELCFHLAKTHGL